MKKLFPLLLIVITISCCSCNNVELKKNPKENEDAKLTGGRMIQFQ